MCRDIHHLTRKSYSAINTYAKNSLSQFLDIASDLKVDMKVLFCAVSLMSDEEDKAKMDDCKKIESIIKKYI